MIWIFAILCGTLVAGDFSLMTAADVNLNPNVTASLGVEYVWGTFLPTLRNVDLLTFNHESTLAGVDTHNEKVIQFEDPIDYLGTYAAVGVDFIVQANNHEFDFGYSGLNTTIRTLNDKVKVPWGGLGETAAEVRTPRIVTAKDGTKVAFFTVVVDECWLWPNKTYYFDACTCGSNAGPSPAYQCYAAGTSGVPSGLWYYWAPTITSDVIQDISSVVGKWKKENPSHLVVIFLHVGANFQWHPYPEHEQLLRNLTTVGGADLVWGTSSHHIQRFEIYNSKPIIYGMGDLLFRHEVGVVDFCPIYAVPCEAYRPDLALNYKFNVETSNGIPSIDLKSMTAFPSQHSDEQTFLVTDRNELHWISSIWNELSQPLTLEFNSTLGGFEIEIN